MTVEFKLKVATMADVDAIQELLYPNYFNESIYGILSYDADSTRNVILNWLDDICIVAEADGKLVALGVMGFIKSFYKEIEADIDMFFVLPEYRGTGISRALADALVQNADANKAGVIYTSCLSGINETNNALYANLWKKFGFAPLGTVMIRS